MKYETELEYYKAKDKETEKKIKEIYKILRNCYDNMGMINESIVFESIFDSINIITETFSEYFKEEMIK